MSQPFQRRTTELSPFSLAAMTAAISPAAMRWLFEGPEVSALIPLRAALELLPDFFQFLLGKRLQKSLRAS
jgi:hypothetical protein